MSQRDMEGIARQWNCSVEEARDRIVARLRAADVVPPDGAVTGDDGRPYARLIQVGVIAETGQYFVRVGEDWVPIEEL
jgi:hypothetical protein